MLGFLYLLLCFTTGWVICSFAFPNLDQITKYSYSKKNISLSPYMIYFPAWFLTGTLVLTWSTYILANLFASSKSPLVYANSITMMAAFTITILMLYYNYRKKGNRVRNHFLCDDKKTRILEGLFVLTVILLANILMWVTFFAKGGKLYVGLSVFSDFSPHIGMIRSFSKGNNFPTWYSHFAGQDIRYHFMFQFLAGNLEFLGMRIDYAFNIPSILSFLSAFMLFYVLALKITGKKAAGILACIFFAFRSAKTLFTYLANIPQGSSILKTLKSNTEFISDTPNENWGLWNLNVYCNQRHLAFGIAVIIFVIILLLPNLYEFFEKWDLKYKDNQLRGSKNKKHLGLKKGFIQKFSWIFFSKEGWVVKDYRTSIALGIMLGGLAFFHGAAVIACLLVLFLVAVLSRKRFEFMIVAVITLVLSSIQTRLFIHGSVVSTKLLFGFIAENKTLFGVASYLERLLGILPFILLAALIFEKGVGRYLILAFTAPLVFSFFVSLTVDVTVNHKYIMISTMLLGIFAAAVIVKLFERRDFLVKAIGVFLILNLTGTGIYDFVTVIKRNNPDNAWVLEMNSPLTEWIEENSDSRDIFLTANYALNQVVFGGAMLYQGWTYFAWSAGYDTAYRDQMVKSMYEADSPEKLDRLIKENRIRFIIVDENNRTSEDYLVNEDNINSTYQAVYQEGEGDYQLTIYDTKLPVF